MNVWAVCGGEYNEFRVHTIFLNEDEANECVTLANEIEQVEVGDYGSFFAADIPVGVKPIQNWRILSGQGLMIRDGTKFEPKKTFVYEWKDGFVVTGTDYDDVLSTYQGKVDPA